jgi:methoxymalonate biosynthesis acyl carrier protein
MNADEICQARDFISSHANGSPINDDEDLFASGLVNSLFAVQLVLWLERNYNITVASTDLDFANFRTLSAIVSFVDRKRCVVEAAAGGGTWTSN